MENIIGFYVIIQVIIELVACRSKKHVKAVAENAPELFQRKLNSITRPTTHKNQLTKFSHNVMVIPSN